MEFGASIFKALGHLTRLRFAQELAKAGHCVGELREMVGADMSTVSKHLLVMKRAGVVAEERRGCHVFYRLAMPCVRDCLVLVDRILKEKKAGS